MGYRFQGAAEKKDARSRAALKTGISGAQGSVCHVRPLEETGLSMVFSISRLCAEESAALGKELIGVLGLHTPCPVQERKGNQGSDQKKGE